MSSPRVITVDGPAGAGKGTLARRLAEHLNYAHLDTGKLYRAVGLGALRAGGDPALPADAVAAAQALDPHAAADGDFKDPANCATRRHGGRRRPRLWRRFPQVRAGPPGRCSAQVSPRIRRMDATGRRS